MTTWADILGKQIASGYADVLFDSEEAFFEAWGKAVLRASLFSVSTEDYTNTHASVVITSGSSRDLHGNQSFPSAVLFPAVGLVAIDEPLTDAMWEAVDSESLDYELFHIACGAGSHYSPSFDFYIEEAGGGFIPAVEQCGWEFELLEPSDPVLAYRYYELGVAAMDDINEELSERGKWATGSEIGVASARMAHALYYARSEWPEDDEVIDNVTTWFAGVPWDDILAGTSTD